MIEDRIVPTGRPLPLPVIYAGAGIGMSPVVTAINAETGNTNFTRTVFESSFLGGVRVAVGDFTHDGFPDVVAAAGPTGGPRVRILDGKTGDQIAGPLGSFFAYEPSFTGGVHVAAADVDGDGTPDVVTAAGPGGGPHVKVFSGATGQVIADFMAFGSDFYGGITVAAADLTGDGKSEVAIGAGLGGGPRVKVYDPLTATPIAGPLGSFFAFDPGSSGGVFVGADALAGDLDFDGTPDLAVGTGPGTTGQVRVFSGKTGAVLRDITPFGANYTSGTRVALAYVTDDPYADVIVGSGPGAPATIRVFDGLTGAQLPAPLGEYQPFGPTGLGGVFVAASNDPDLTGNFDRTFGVYLGAPTGELVLGDLLELDGNTDPEQYAVTIDWGDGTPTSEGWVVFTGEDGTGQVTYDVMGGPHTYTAPTEMDPYIVSVTVEDSDGDLVDGTDEMTVAMPTGMLRTVRTDGTGEDTEGWVPENNDNDNYNFNGDPDTSLDEIIDKDELGQVEYENDLVALHIYPVDGASASDIVTLSFTSSNIHIWRGPDKSGGQVISDVTTFDPLSSTTVWVEGLNLSSAVNAEVVTLKWQSGANPAIQFALDQVFLSTYRHVGARNVPGFSRHTYTVTVPGANAATFTVSNGGSLHAPATSKAAPGGGATITTAAIDWDAGDEVGKYKVTVAPGWPSPLREVNVVMVALDVDGEDNQLQLDPSHQAQSAEIQKRGVDSSTDPVDEPSMYASIEVSRIAGPMVGTSRRGQRWIDMGFIQMSTTVHQHGDYNGTNPPFRIAASMEGKTFIDSAHALDKPWVEDVYDDLGPAGRRSHDRIGTDVEITDKLFDMRDSPSVEAVESLTVDGDLVDFFSIVLNFNTYFAVHTQEGSNGADQSFTIRARVDWSWNGSGNIDNASAWTSSVAQPLTTPAQPRVLTEKMEREIVDPVLTNGITANAADDAKTWTRANQ